MGEGAAGEGCARGDIPGRGGCAGGTGVTAGPPAQTLVRQCPLQPPLGTTKGTIVTISLGVSPGVSLGVSVSPTGIPMSLTMSPGVSLCPQGVPVSHHIPRGWPLGVPVSLTMSSGVSPVGSPCLTVSPGGVPVSPGGSMSMSLLSSASMFLGFLRGGRRSRSDARSRGCPNTFLGTVTAGLAGRGVSGTPPDPPDTLRSQGQCGGGGRVWGFCTHPWDTQSH